MHGKDDKKKKIKSLLDDFFVFFMLLSPNESRLFRHEIRWPISLARVVQCFLDFTEGDGVLGNEAGVVEGVATGEVVAEVVALDAEGGDIAGVDDSLEVVVVAHAVGMGAKCQWFQDGFGQSDGGEVLKRPGGIFNEVVKEADAFLGVSLPHRSDHQ